MSDAKDVNDKIRRAMDMVSALCNGSREWIMSIPARVDHDPDIVISEALREAREYIATLTRERDEAREEREGAYRERNQVVAWASRLSIAAGYVVRVTKTAIDGWDLAWHNCAYVMTPTGQASWHFHDDDAPLFADLPHGEVVWDGHTTLEKYDRLHRARYATRERDEARVVTDAMVERAWRRLVDQCGHEWFDDREDTGLINSPDKEDIRAALIAALTQEDA
jgi:hypothetical protein